FDETFLIFQSRQRADAALRCRCQDAFKVVAIPKTGVSSSLCRGVIEALFVLPRLRLDKVTFYRRRTYQHAMNMNRYTNAELADIHFINGLTNGNRCADV
ncbi:hypothetical protein TNCV_3442631, partial [Trichonephila clavipes]